LQGKPIHLVEPAATAVSPVVASQFESNATTALKSSKEKSLSPINGAGMLQR